VVRSGRDTIIVLPFTEAEMDSIYREMIALRIFDIEEPYPSFIAEQETPWPGFHSPGGTKRIEVRAGSASKHFYVHYPPYTGRTVKASDNWKRLNQWTYLIEQLAERKPAFRALPRPPPYL